MFSNGKSIAVWPVQKEDLLQNTIDCRIIDVQDKINTLLSAGYTIYDVASSTNSGFNALISATSGNRVCIWKSAGSTAYTLYSTELASNGTNVIINATLNNMNQVTALRDCKLTCSGSSFANKAEFYGGDWYIASWTTGSNVKFTNCDVYCYSSEVYMPDVNFEYANMYFKKSGTIAYSTYKLNTDVRFVNMTTAGSTESKLTIAVAYTTDTDWFLRCTLVDWQNTGTPVISSTVARTLNFTGLKIENSNLAMTNVYTTEGNKIYYEGQDITLSGSNTAQAWSALGGNISISSGTYPSMAVDQNGIPYVAFTDNNSTGANGKASCYKYGSTGWTVVGYTGLSSNTMDYVNLCISTDNDVVIVGRDNSSKASAYYLSAAASSWNLLGSAGFSSQIANNLKASYFSTGTNKIFLTTISNTSVAASTSDDHIYAYVYNYSLSSGWDYRWAGSLDYIIENQALSGEYIYYSCSTTLKYNVFGRYWNYNSTVYTVTMNQANYSTYSINKLSAAYPYFALIDETSKVTVMQQSGSSWLKIGNYPLSTGTAQNMSLANINNIPYVAIQDTTAKATVYKYVSANSSWNLVGTANFSTDNVGALSLASFGGTPYLAVQEYTTQGIAAYSFGETVTNSNINYTFENLETDIFSGEYSLPVSQIQSSSNYITQNCMVKPMYNIVDTVVGRFIRNTYSIDLNARWNPPVDDTLKEVNADTFWVIDRTDVEATLSGKIVKNLKLYNSDLSAYTYNSNDNFLIIGSNAQKGNAVFCYYNNKVRATVFSDQYLDTAYTITDCIQLWAVDDIADLQNIVSSTKLSDGPLESGSITFNNFDNEGIVS